MDSTTRSYNRFYQSKPDLSAKSILTVKPVFRKKIKQFKRVKSVSVLNIEFKELNPVLIIKINVIDRSYNIFEELKRFSSKNWFCSSTFISSK